MTVDRRAFSVGATSLIASALLSSRPTAADNAWEHVAAAGKREGKLGVITPSTSPAFKSLVENFEKDTGIETSLLVARPAEVRERIRVAKVAGRPIGDIMYTSYAQVKLFDAEDEHGVVLLRQQGMARQVHAGGAAGAGVLDVVDRDAAHAQVADDQLAQDHAAEHVGAIDRLDLVEGRAGVFDGAQDGLLRQFGGVYPGVAAEGGHRAARNIDVWHGNARHSWTGLKT